MTFSQWHVREYGETLTDAYRFFISTVGKEKADIIMRMREDKYKEENETKALFERKGELIWKKT
ncbi:hypothetical protein OF830_28570 [Bacillus paramycoides]|uniref:hypothetical protein n=1 Tax=Bacillus paramycoides TaxID=2026194 RepID=UPI002243D728|nr:hypothetical protein [Bacillus paramycoides]MCW9134705.1 hypothetical protein [Bacillus paramycoides]